MNCKSTLKAYINRCEKSSKDKSAEGKNYYLKPALRNASALLFACSFS